MVQPQEQMVTWAGLWGTRGGNNCSNCPLGQWFLPLKATREERTLGPCGCADTYLTELLQKIDGLVQTS